MKVENFVGDFKMKKTKRKRNITRTATLDAVHYDLSIKNTWMYFGTHYENRPNFISFSGCVSWYKDTDIFRSPKRTASFGPFRNLIVFTRCDEKNTNHTNSFIS